MKFQLCLGMKLVILSWLMAALQLQKTTAVMLVQSLNPGVILQTRTIAGKSVTSALVQVCLELCIYLGVKQPVTG